MEKGRTPHFFPPRIWVHEAETKQNAQKWKKKVICFKD
jgi:hypothetical protein